MTARHGSGSALTSCLVALALVAPTGWARAEEPRATDSPAPPAPLGPDEVELLDGGFVRGTLVEVTPKVRVVIVPDGTSEHREIPWSDIADVQRGKHDGGSAETWPKEAPAPPPKLDEASLGKPRIHLELTRRRPVKLYEVNSEIVASGYYSSAYGIQYRSLCAAPCDRVVDGTRGQDFFLATGDPATTTASRRFSLDARQGDVTLHVKPGNAALRIAGAVLLGLGIGCLIGGTVLVAKESTRSLGYVFLGIGAPGLAAGIAMTIVGRTRYELADTDDAEPRTQQPAGAQ